MAHAEKCPVCGGSGKAVPEGPWGGGPSTYPTCHGCQGKGWVTVEDHRTPLASIPELYEWAVRGQFCGPPTGSAPVSGTDATTYYTEAR